MLDGGEGERGGGYGRREQRFKRFSLTYFVFSFKATEKGLNEDDDDDDDVGFAFRD